MLRIKHHLKTKKYNNANKEAILHCQVIPKLEISIFLAPHLHKT